MSIAKENEIIAIGRIGLDFFSMEEGKSLRDVRNYRATQGGSLSNIAVNLSKLGHSVKLVTKVGDEPLGRFLVDYVNNAGVDTTHVKYDKNHKTSVAVVEVFPPDSFTTLFFREKCADIYIDYDDIPYEDVMKTRLLITSGTSFTGSPAREAILYTMQRISLEQVAKPTIVLDIDFRESLWKSRNDAAFYLWQASTMADIIFANDEELELLAGICPSHNPIEELLKTRERLVIHKKGRRGAVIHKKGEEVVVEAIPVKVVSTNGAGDAFAAAFLHGLLEGKTLFEAGTLGSAAGAIVVGRIGCSEAMPSIEEISRFLDENLVNK